MYLGGSFCYWLAIHTMYLEFSRETRVLILYILNLVSMRGVFFPGHPAGNSKVSLYMR
jgi:hypothetical protein